MLSVNRGTSKDKYEIERTTRLPGTRAVVHTHDWGGVTCLQQGETTLLLDGLAEPVTRHAGECYWMPAKRFMTGVNTGNEIALMWDIFGSCLPITIKARRLDAYGPAASSSSSGSSS